jgi:hypothetical protein
MRAAKHGPGRCIRGRAPAQDNGNQGADANRERFLADSSQQRGHGGGSYATAIRLVVATPPVRTSGRGRTEAVLGAAPHAAREDAPQGI